MNRKTFAVAVLLLFVLLTLSVGINSRYDAVHSGNDRSDIDCAEYERIGDLDIYRFTYGMGDSKLFEDDSEDCLDDYYITVSTNVDNRKYLTELDVQFFNSQDILIGTYHALIDVDGTIIEYETTGDIQQITGTRGLDNVVGLVGNVERLTSLLPQVASGTLIEKITKALANSVLKKVLRALVGVVIPVAGWIWFAISVGISIYEIIQLADEIVDLIDLAETDIDGYKYDVNSNQLKLAERYCGEDGGIFNMSLAITCYSSKRDGKYYAAMHIDEYVLISDRTISFDNAVELLNIMDGNSPLDFYTPLHTDAQSVAQQVSGNRPLNHHDYLHDGLAWGFAHYHHYLHIPNVGSVTGQYPTHGFYGEVIIGDLHYH